MMALLNTESFTKTLYKCLRRTQKILGERKHWVGGMSTCLVLYYIFSFLVHFVYVQADPWTPLCNC